MTFNIYVIVILIFGLNIICVSPQQQRTFRVDYENDKFLLNGQDFQYVAGSFHYFRTVPEVWPARIKTMRQAGLNVLDTYVEWALHNPQDGVYDFSGIANLTRFLDVAVAEGLLVILRPGPYICAERDNGGVPYWLFTKYPNIKLRTKDTNYLKEVEIWYANLMPQLVPYMYENGGPIIMVQVENEYSSYYACDREYMNWLRDETEKYVQKKAVLFTVDIPTTPGQMRCGTADDVFATTDFGIEVGENEMDSVWDKLREIQPKGPLVNSEFYPGWLTHWHDKNQRRDGERGANVIKRMLEAGASVNIYMFFGGTNFGFTAGANGPLVGGYLGEYTADITSYDYDAVMDEAGDPNEFGSKYQKYQAVITQFFNITPETVTRAPKMVLPSVRLNPKGYLISEKGKNYLGKDVDGKNKTVTSQRPLSFETLDQFSGFVLYETELPILELDPTEIVVNTLHDRALVYVNQEYVGCLSRENNISSLAVHPGLGNKLQILVENQGRINYNVTDDFKGILGSVTISQRSGVPLELLRWTMTGFPLTNYAHIGDFLKDKNTENVRISPNGMLTGGPVIFHAEFQVTADEIYDTYLDVSGWGKGILYINGFNLGRYWPSVGPQITMYVPGNILKRGTNDMVIIELQRLSPRNNYYVRFVNESILDGSPDGNIGGNNGVNNALTVTSLPHLLTILIAFILFKNY
ncbi:Beta-galactosidase [Pseudolycoriella hygida]|uniref:Beta-galactosidase n=1 Tax=Pseudolycoriella hygida TaxID=35572 RepID=A0A9Q0S7E7_9DIPT|nr:Beta-galactosidase [Pseudolycoriella hygida]